MKNLIPFETFLAAFKWYFATASGPLAAAYYTLDHNHMNRVIEIRTFGVPPERQGEFQLLV